MALVIEDGTRVSGANSYVTLAEFKAWADSRGITYGTDQVIESQILRAMDYIEGLSFIGFKETQTQPLQWPRVNVVIDGFGLEASTIPGQLKTAVYEATKVEIDGDSKLAAVDRQVTRETVDSISVTYKDNAAMQRATPALTSALRKLVQSPMAVMRA
jgi:hypothetical protein